MHGKQYWIGHTREYVKVALESDKDCQNRMILGEISGFMEDDILCMEKNTLSFL